MPDCDLIVVGNETEGCLAAIAAARAGASVLLLTRPGARLGGLLTEGGLAYVDRDARHLKDPVDSPEDGLFAEFLARAGVGLVALDAQTGESTLAAMLAEAGVKRLAGHIQGVRVADGRITALNLGEEVGDRQPASLTARHFIDATPDGDLAELAGVRFTPGFSEYGLDNYLGVSPLPLVTGLPLEQLYRDLANLAGDSHLKDLKDKLFGKRQFLDLERGDDYILVGPPHLALAYHAHREAVGWQSPYRFEADGFNVAVLSSDGNRSRTSWNGLIYFCNDPATLLALSRDGIDEALKLEVTRFETFLTQVMGWSDAQVTMPSHVYVRQTRHALDVRHRLKLAELAAGYDRHSVGTFCYYPDFRGFRAVAVPGPLAVHVILEAGLAANVRNLGIASRAGGYTPFAHSICRLVQYNVTLGVALGVAAALASGDDLGAATVAAIKATMATIKASSDDPSGFERSAAIAAALGADSVVASEIA